MPRLQLLAVVGLLMLIAAQGVRDKRSPAGSSIYMIEIDGMGSVGVTGVSGGYAAGEVVSTPTGNELAPQKRIAAVRVVPVTIEVSLGELSSWITQSLGGAAQPVSGRILEMDHNYTIVGERQFQDAVLTEVVFPALDASSPKEPARVKLTFQPQRITSKKGDGSKASSALGKDAKRAMTSAFRVTIPGVDCTGVAKVEPIAIKFKLSDATAGEAKMTKSQVTGMTVGDLLLSVADTKSASLAQWAEDSLSSAGSTEKEKTVTIELLSPDMKTTLSTLEGHGVGIYALKPAGSGGADQVKRAEAQMYVERWQLK
jgi:hypothetical protein